MIQVISRKNKILSKILEEGDTSKKEESDKSKCSSVTSSEKQRYKREKHFGFFNAHNFEEGSPEAKATGVRGYKENNLLFIEKQDSVD